MRRAIARRHASDQSWLKISRDGPLTLEHQGLRNLRNHSCIKCIYTGVSLFPDIGWSQSVVTHTVLLGCSCTSGGIPTSENGGVDFGARAVLLFALPPLWRQHRLTIILQHRETGRRGWRGPIVGSYPHSIGHRCRAHLLSRCVLHAVSLEHPLHQRRET